MLTIRQKKTFQSTRDWSRSSTDHRAPTIWRSSSTTGTSPIPTPPDDRRETGAIALCEPGAEVDSVRKQLKVHTVHLRPRKRVKPAIGLSGEARIAMPCVRQFAPPDASRYSVLHARVGLHQRNAQRKLSQRADGAACSPSESSAPAPAACSRWRAIAGGGGLRRECRAGHMQRSHSRAGVAPLARTSRSSRC